jgi:hypothetical protein
MTTAINYTADTKTAKSTLGRLIWVAPVAIATSTAANIALYATAGRLFPEVTAWGGAGIGQIIGANIGYLFFGTIIFALINWFSSRPTRHYTIVATIGLLFSLGLPISAGFGTSPASLATVITLSLMHVVSFAISVPMFNRFASAK